MLTLRPSRLVRLHESRYFGKFGKAETLSESEPLS